MKGLIIPRILYAIPAIFAAWGLADTGLYNKSERSSLYYGAQILVYIVLFVVSLVVAALTVFSQTRTITNKHKDVLIPFIFSLIVLIYGIVDMYRIKNKDKGDVYYKAQQGIYITTLILVIGLVGYYYY